MVAPLLVKVPVPAALPEVRLPWIVTVVVVLPMLTALALPVPMLMVPFVPVAVPVSREIFPEF